MKIRKVLLFNPPVGLYQRGEERCQADIEGSATISIRPPNNLGYMASVLRLIGITPLIRDYPVEKDKDFITDLKAFNPDMLIMSITTATIEKDLEYFKIAKDVKKDIITVAEGAHFITAPLSSFNKEVYNFMDFAIYGESEGIVDKLVDALNNNLNVSYVKGLIFKENNRWIKTPPSPFIEDLDSLPFPARDLMRNELYINPDTGNPIATIQTSRGCPAKCIYCLTPIVSGSKVRKRSAKNIVDEIEECINKYNIKEFFFRADTFTIDNEWVVSVCKETIKRDLKISWVANSRVKPLSEDALLWMKKAGCYLVAFGIESGSNRSLKLMKKGATVSDAIRAVNMAKRVGLKTYCFFMLGFPWEKREDIEETIRFSKKIPCDFAEFHIATPYYGTELFEMVKNEGLIDKEIVGYNYFTNPAVGTKYLSRDELIHLRRKALLSFYLRPNYILKTFLSISSEKKFANYLRYGLKLIKNTIFKTR